MIELIFFGTHALIISLHLALTHKIDKARRASQ